ncbi:Uncharacterised protein [uncultured archaeon]|nr:Uncharacterised protein [uncultured archaeon]
MTEREDKHPRSLRGFVLSLDAMLAVFIFIMFWISIMGISAQYASDPFNSLLSLKQADDALAVLDRNQTFASQNAAAINSSLYSLLANSNNWSLEVRYYIYSSSGFSLVGTQNLGTNSSHAKGAVFTQREFLVLTNTSAPYYGVARLRLWH